ncbi:hypothetical protein Tsubulata_024111, partial [Turnera subulata]
IEPSPHFFLSNFTILSNFFSQISQTPTSDRRQRHCYLACHRRRQKRRRRRQSRRYYLPPSCLFLSSCHNCIGSSRSIGTTTDALLCFDLAGLQEDQFLRRE